MKPFWNETISNCAEMYGDLVLGKDLVFKQNTVAILSEFHYKGLIDLYLKNDQKNTNLVREIVKRILIGKKAITLPGNKRKKRQEKEREKLKKNLPKELLAAIETVYTNSAKAIQQYKDGNAKALNAMVGMVMKNFKHDASIIKDLLMDKISAS